MMRISERISAEMLVLYAFIGRQFALYKRYWHWELMWIAYTFANTLAIGFLGSGVGMVTGQEVDSKTLIIYLLIGSLMWGYLAGLFWEVGSVVSWERWEGTIEYTFMAPISRITHLIGMCLFAIIYGVLRTVLILGAVAIFFDLDISGADLPGALLILVTSSVSLVGIGMMVAILPLFSPEKGTQIMGIIEALILMVSGVYYPIDVLPSWMRWLSWISPATYTLSGMRKALLSKEGISGLFPELAALLLMGLIAVPLGFLVFSWAERRAKRIGMLSRSG
jgi:ABC-2 type transport system permease protein